ncbi:MAG TPA: PH domain-containing protein [Thermoanaerobaculia bacterium]
MKARLLRFLRVSEQPDPPPGAGEDLAVFRASRRYLWLSVLAWIPKQLWAVAGLVFALAFFGTIDTPFFEAEGWERFMEVMDGIRFEVGGWTLSVAMTFELFELGAVALFAAQLAFSGATLLLAWELRWYMVGDDALRIREGLWTVREQTITIANVQKMTIHQTPLHKLFGVADLEVHTAGGGSGVKDDDKKQGAQPFHVARFRGLEDAETLRDRIRARLVLHRGTGLGDADEDADVPERHPGGEERAVAARALLAETRALRRVTAYFFQRCKRRPSRVEEARPNTNR